MKMIIDKYLSENREEKIRNCLEEFEGNVLNEMMIENDKYAIRQNFMLFFRIYLPTLRRELYEEFKGYMSDTEFDLTIRRAIASYDGMSEFV
jgi:hypothetical protein